MGADCSHRKNLTTGHVLPNYTLSQIRAEPDGWMTCYFMSISTVFQPYQHDGQMIMKGCVQQDPVYGCEDFASSGALTQDC